MAKQGGGDGWADVWKKGCFGWEYKGKHKDLDAAYKQLLDYRDALHNPPLLVVCDMDRFSVHTNFTNTRERLLRVRHATPAEDRRSAALPTSRCCAPPSRTPRRSNRARPAAHHRGRGAEPGEIAIGMRAAASTPCTRRPLPDPHRLLPLRRGHRPAAHASRSTTLLKKTHHNLARDLTNRYIAQLLELMAGGGELGFEEIPWFNGGLFDGSAAIALENGEALRLERAADFDWAAIEPSIFGTLLERSLDPKR